MPRKKLRAKDEIKKYTDLILTDVDCLKSHAGQWSKDVFKNNQPLFVELGAGKSKFTVELAEKNPNHNYLAIEIKEERSLSGAKKAIAKSLNNIKFLCLSIKHLPDIFKEGEIKGLYINFPDPWPKKRHIKRRTASADFLELYKNVLAPSGFLQLKTDNQLFFHYAASEFLQHKWKITDMDLNVLDNNENICTEFEEKFRKKGLPIYMLRTSYALFR